MLLILAAVSLSSVFSDKGIFNKAEIAGTKYNEAKARELLELTLGEAQLQKYEEGLEEEQLDRKIQEIGELLPKEDPNPNIQDVIVEGYIFKVDKSVPKIIEFVDRADGIIITAVLSNNATDGWLSAAESDVNIRGKIITYSGGKITTVNAKSGTTPIPGFTIDSNGLYEINNITESSIITIEAEDSKGKTKSKEINVEVKIDKTAPTVETVNAAVEGRKIKLSATGHDKAPNGEEQSGIKEFSYTITPADGVDKPTGTFSKNGTAEINVTNWTLYTIKLTATDKVGNISETPKEQTADVKDTISPVISNVTAEASFKKITINASATDGESGVKELRYSVSPETISPSSGVLTGTPVELTATELREYTITFTAVDNAGNQATPVTTKATTSDAMSVEEAKRLVTNMATLKEHMGEKVNYKAGETWQIFYYDEAGEFGKAKTLYLRKSTGDSRALTLSTKISQTDSAVQMMRKMNPKWANSSYSTVDNNNEKACVWLCDTSVWNTERNEKYSSFAIGAPSVEMYTKAYNVHATGNKDANNLVCKIESANGYMIGKNGTYSNSGKYASVSGMGDSVSSELGQGWLCSPSCESSTCVNVITHEYSTVNSTASLKKRNSVNMLQVSSRHIRQVAVITGMESSYVTRKEYTSKRTVRPIVPLDV